MGQAETISPSTPAIWREMFSIIPDENFGLNLDPSHLVWLMIDSLRVVREFSERIFHIHAKDLEIDLDGLYENGTQSRGWDGRFPGCLVLAKLIGAALSASFTDMATIMLFLLSMKTDNLKAQKNLSSAVS